MKAIIMAGGEGTRLRPVSANRPKPMTELFDKPVLEHILRLLKLNGVTEACLTLKYLPQMIKDYFGSGEAFGIRLNYRVEREALGTAGGVLNCADFIGDEEFLVMSGDCVCDFDLKSLMDFHREKKAEATLGLYSHKSPLEYGLVVTTKKGRVERFLEKPAWDNVLTDHINTGIYVLSPSVLREIPQNKPYDFGRELFPRLLEDDRALYGRVLEGYWCDIGTGKAYLQCCMDILDGRVGVVLDVPSRKDGVWTSSPLPEGAQIVAPVYIGPGAVIDRGATIGPYAVIGVDSVVSAGAKISYSAVNGAVVGEEVTVTGAVVCRGARLGGGSVLSEGSIVGEGSHIGEGCLLGASAKIWPDRQIPVGSVVTGSVSLGMLKSSLTFLKPGVIAGPYGDTVSVEDAIKLGGAAGAYKRVGVAWSGGEASRVLAEAFGSGVCAGGGDLIRLDASFASAASYAGSILGLELTVFIENSGENVTITFFGKDGFILARETERKLEAAVSQAQRVASRRTGQASNADGISEAYIAAAARTAAFSPDGAEGYRATVIGRGAENRALKSALELLGVDASGQSSGRIRLDVQTGGFTLSAVDEEAYRLSPEQLFLIAAFIDLKTGTKTLAATYDAPAVLEELARGFGAAVLRVGRDGMRAQALYQRQAYLRDGVFMGARLCAYLGQKGEKLSALRAQLPRFSTATREVELKGDRGAVMRMLLNDSMGQTRETSSGLRLDTDLGYVTIAPLRTRSALRIRSESFNEETAEELCAEFEQRARRADNG